MHPGGLAQALGDAGQAGGPVGIELQDSLIYELDLGDVAGHTTVDGSPNLALAHPLIIRAASGQRPILRLARPLRFGPVPPVSRGRRPASRCGWRVCS